MSFSEMPNPVAPSRSRIGWLDVARGIALLAMASYHLTWDFEYFGYLEPGTAGHGFPKAYARLIASTFLLLAGFSLALGHRDRIHWRRFAIRFVKLAAAAGAITITTYYFMPQAFIHFGILHEIALASVIGLLFLRVPVLITFAVAFFVLLLPHFFTSPVFDTPWLWWTGLAPKPPVSFDYVPVFPWLSPVLFGIGFGNIGGVRNWLRNLSARQWIMRPFALAGRHSLIVYLLHQIPLFGLVYLMTIISPPDRATAYLRECQQTCASSGSGALCQRFCSCTLDKLNADNLLVPLQTGKLDVEDSRIQALALQCSIDAQK